MSEETTARDRARALVFGKTTKKTVEIEGEKFELREPTLSEAADFQELVGDEKSPTAKGNLRALCRAVCLLTYDPETGERMFADEDEERLMHASPKGGMGALIEHVSDLLSVDSDDLGNGSGETSGAS